jgi:hypothetical protein
MESLKLCDYSTIGCGSSSWRHQVVIVSCFVPSEMSDVVIREILL